MQIPLPDFLHPVTAGAPVYCGTASGGGTPGRSLVLERGVITTVDSVSLLMAMVNQGMSIPLAGTIILRDSFGEAQREWSVVGAHLQKYVGPQLNSNQASVAVSRIELIHNGCF